MHVEAQHNFIDIFNNIDYFFVFVQLGSSCKLNSRISSQVGSRKLRPKNKNLPILSKICLLLSDLVPNIQTSGPTKLEANLVLEWQLLLMTGERKLKAWAVRRRHHS